MTSVAKYQRSLQAYKGHITRGINNCNSVKTSVPEDVDRLETSISFLESKWPVYEEAYMRLENALIQEGSDEDSSTSQADYYAVWDEYQNNLVKFRSHLRSTKPETTVGGSTAADPTPTYVKPKLPEIKLPYFSGDHTNMRPFTINFKLRLVFGVI